MENSARLNGKIDPYTDFYTRSGLFNPRKEGFFVVFGSVDDMKDFIKKYGSAEPAVNPGSEEVNSEAEEKLIEPKSRNDNKREKIGTEVGFRNGSIGDGNIGGRNSEKDISRNGITPRYISIDNGNTAEIIYIYSVVPCILLKGSADFMFDLAATADNIGIYANFGAYLCIEHVRYILRLGILDNMIPPGGGKGVKIAVVDSGIDDRHPDLRGKVLYRINLTSEKENDPCGHGTMMAGIIAGTGRLSEGRFAGIAPAAELIDVKITDVSGRCRYSDILLALEALNGEDVDIIYFGMAGAVPTDGNDPITGACREFIRRNIIIIAPAGNFGPESDTIGPPGLCPDVICVGSADKLGKVAFYSSRGRNNPENGGDDGVRPDFILPSVKLTVPSSVFCVLGRHFIDGKGYSTVSGSGAAAAVAAGLCALIKGYIPETTPDEIRRILRESCEPPVGEYSRISAGCGLPDPVKYLIEKGIVIEPPAPIGKFVVKAAAVAISVLMGIILILMFLNLYIGKV